MYWVACSKNKSIIWRASVTPPSRVSLASASGLITSVLPWSRLDVIGVYRSRYEMRRTDTNALLRSLKRGKGHATLCRGRGHPER